MRIFRSGIALILSAAMAWPVSISRPRGEGFIHLAPPTANRDAKDPSYAAYQAGLERGYFVPQDIPGAEVDAAAFAAAVGKPGAYPNTRSVLLKGSEGLTVRKYWSYPTPDQTNAVFKEVLATGGQPSMAFDLPTQFGIDPDEADIPDIGGTGVSMVHFGNYEQAFEGIDPTQITANFTINSTAMFVVASYEALVRKRFSHLSPAELNQILAKLRGTIQNDVYKEYVARNTHVFPILGTNTLMADFVEHAQRVLSSFRLVSVCGYHMREKECSPSQEMAYAIANALQYVAVTLREKKDLDPNKFVPLFSFFFNTKQAGYRQDDETQPPQNLSLLTEAAKLRAARRVWARLMKEGLKLQEKRAHSLLAMNYSGGTEATKGKMELTIARLALQSMASILGTPQGTNSYSADEAIDIPGLFYGRLSILIDLITLQERGLTRPVDPAGGSYYLEVLTEEFEREIWTELREMAKLPSHQHALARIKNKTDETSKQMETAYNARPGSPQHIPKIGRNVFEEDKGAYPTQTAEVVLPHSQMQIEKARLEKQNEEYAVPSLTQQQIERLRSLPEAVRRRVADIETKLGTSGLKPWVKIQLVSLRDHLIARDPEKAEAMFRRLEEAARTRKENLMDVTVEAVQAGITVGEWKKVLAGVFGVSQEVAGERASATDGPWNSQTPRGGLPSVPQPAIEVFTDGLRSFIAGVSLPESKLSQGLRRGYFEGGDTAYLKKDPLERPGEFPYTRGSTSAPYRFEVRPPRTGSETPDPMNLDGWALAEAGATAEQEVALLIEQAHALAEKRQKEEGISPAETLKGISLALSVGDSAIEEVSKFRTARRVWAEYFHLLYGLPYDHDALKVKLHARTAGHTLAKEQCWANAARIAQQAMLAAWGGADSIECMPFDAPFRDKQNETEWSEWADQMALDTARLIKLEAGGEAVRDPLGGAPAIEVTTQKMSAQVRAILRGGAASVIEKLASQKEERKQRKRVGADAKPEDRYVPKRIPRRAGTAVPAQPAKIELAAPRPAAPARPLAYHDYLAEPVAPWQPETVRALLHRHGFATDTKTVSLWLDRVRNELTQEGHHQPGRLKILTAKVGADGHDRGILFISSMLAHAGCVVTLQPMRSTIPSVVRAAIDEDVHVVAISTSKALEYVHEYFREMARRGEHPQQFALIAGGAIPPADIAKLREMGIPAFGAESHPDDIVRAIQQLMFRRKMEDLLWKVADLSHRPPTHTPPPAPRPEIIKEYLDHPHLYWPPGLAYAVEKRDVAAIEKAARRGGLFFATPGAGMLTIGWPNGYRLFLDFGEGTSELIRDVANIKARMRKLFEENPALFFNDPLKDSLPARFAEIREEYQRAATMAREAAAKDADPATTDRLFEEAFLILDEKYLELKVWERWNIGRTLVPQTRLSPKQIIFESGLFDNSRAAEFADPKLSSVSVKSVSFEQVNAFCDLFELKKPADSETPVQKRSKFQKRDAARLFLQYGLDEKNINAVRKKYGLADNGEAIQVMVAEHELSLDDPTVFASLTRYVGPAKDKNQSVLVVALQKGFTAEERKQTNMDGYIRPRGIRKIIRAIRLAEMLRLPMIFLNDSTGAWVGVEADLDDQGQAISRLITVQYQKRAPGISFITGEAGSAPILATSIDPTYMLQYSFRNTSNPHSAWLFENIEPEVRKFYETAPLDELPNPRSRSRGGQAEPAWRNMLYEDAKTEILKEIADAVAGLPSENLKNGQIAGIVAEPHFGGLRDPQGLAASMGAVLDRWLEEIQTQSVSQIQAQRRRYWRAQTPRYPVHPNPPERKFIAEKGKLSIRARLKQLTGKEDFDEELNAGLMTHPSDFYSRIPSLQAIPAFRGDPYAGDVEKAIAKTGNLCGVATGWATIGGHKAMLIVREPYFIAGSKAGVEGEKMSLAIEAAIRHYDRTGERLPVVMVTTGAGARSADQVWGMGELAKNNMAIDEAQRRGIPVIDIDAHYVLGGCAASTFPAATVNIAETTTAQVKVKEKVKGDGENGDAAEKEIEKTVDKVFEPMSAFVGPKASDSLEPVPDALKRASVRKLRHSLDLIVDREELPKKVAELIAQFREREKETDDPDQLMRFEGVNTARWRQTYKRGKTPCANPSKIQDFAWRETLVLKQQIEAGVLNWRLEKTGASDKRYNAHFTRGTRDQLLSRELPLAGIPFSDRFDFDREPGLLVATARKNLLERIRRQERIDGSKFVLLPVNHFSRASNAEKLKGMIRASVSTQPHKVVHFLDAGPAPSALPFWHGAPVSFDRYPNKEALEYYGGIVQLARNKMFAEIKRIYDELGYDVVITEEEEIAEVHRQDIHRRLAPRRFDYFVQRPDFGVEFLKKETGSHVGCKEAAKAYVIVATKRGLAAAAVSAAGKAKTPFKLFPGEFLGKDLGRPVGLGGVGVTLPSRRLSNAELEEEARRVAGEMKARGVQIKDGELYSAADFNTKGTGIVSRYWFDPSRDNPPQMAARALVEALRQCGISIEQLKRDWKPWMFGVATYPAGVGVISPGVGPLVQRFLELPFAFPAISGDAVCPGWIAAVTFSLAHVANKSADVLLIPIVEWYSRNLRPDSRSSWPVFGDMAAGTVFVPAQEGHGILWGIYQTEAGEREIKAKARGKEIGPVILSEIIETPIGGHFQMHGQAVGAMATEKGMFLIHRCVEAMQHLGLGDDLNNIDWFIFHQANKGLILELARILKIPEGKLLFTVEDLANTSAASIPATLHRHADKIKPGQLVTMATFGGGFQWGALLMRWGGAPSQETKEKFGLAQEPVAFDIAI